MENPINSLLSVSMENLKKLVDVDTIIGNVIKIDDVSIIPISKVKVGFLSGGSEIGKVGKLPFGGASGSNMSIEPVCFIVYKGNDVKLLNANKGIDIAGIIDSFYEVRELFKDSGKIKKV